MTPRDAADRFVELVLRTTFDDALDLADPADADHAPDARAQAYAAVEAAVRRQFKVRHDLGALEDAVERVVPKQHQAKFTKLSNAIGAELGVVRQAGYVVRLSTKFGPLVMPKCGPPARLTTSSFLSATRT